MQLRQAGNPRDLSLDRTCGPDSLFPVVTGDGFPES